MKNKRKLTKGEITAICILGALIVIVACVGAWLIIGNVNKANELAENATSAPTVSTETTAAPTHGENATVSKSDEETTKSTASQADDKGSAEKATTGSPTDATDAAASNGNSGSDTSSGKSKKVKEAVTYTDGPVPVVEPETQQCTHESEKTLTINGKTVYVGDTITVAVNLKSPVVLINYQGFTSYDSSVLKFVSAKSNSGGLVNNKDASVYYNSSVLSGMDFTSGGTICTITFEVIKEGSTKLANTLEVASDLDLKDVGVSNCELTAKVYD